LSNSIFKTRRHGVWVPAFAGTTALVFILTAALSPCAFAATTDPAAQPQVDPAPCVAAITDADGERIVAACSVLIDNDKTQKADRIKALIARGFVFGRKEQLDRAIADYDAALLIDPTLANAFNARGELWLRKGDRPRALADFAAALKLNPDHSMARFNYKSLAWELEMEGAHMGLKPTAVKIPSLDCVAARQAAEKAICASPELLDLDRRINALNTKVVQDAAKDSPRAGYALLRVQEDFIARRNAGFGRPGYDLRKAMNERLEHLKAVDRY
jgi:tetratricopeptide (TPR) repeat protein